MVAGSSSIPALPPDSLPDVPASDDDADSLAEPPLRDFEDRSATTTLLRLLADRHGAVADAALVSLDRSRPARDDSVRLAAFALGGAFVPALAGRLTSALLRRRDDDPWVRAALVAVRARAHDPRERGRIDAALGARWRST